MTGSHFHYSIKNLKPINDFSGFFGESDAINFKEGKTVENSSGLRVAKCKWHSKNPCIMPLRRLVRSMWEDRWRRSRNNALFYWRNFERPPSSLH